MIIRRIALISFIGLLPLAPLSAGAGTLLVANKSDDTVDLIDLESGQSRRTLPTGHAPHEIEVSPDGSLAVISNYGDRQQPGSSLTVVDVAGGRVVRTIDLGRHSRPHGLAWIGESRVAVTTEGSAHLLVVDVESGDITTEVETGQEVSHMVAVTPDGGRAFVANIGSGTVTAVDLVAGRKIADIATGAGAEGVAVSADGREVWVGNRADDTLSVLDTATLEVRATVPCPGFPIRVAFSPDGGRVVVSAARSGEVVAFDAVRRAEIGRRKLDFTTVPGAADRLFGDQFGDSPVPVGLVIAPGGDSVWVASTQADVVAVVGAEQLEVRDLLRAGREPDGMAWSSRRVAPQRD